MFSDLAEQLLIREQQGLKRYRSILESPQSTHVTIDGHAYLSFSSNDYLGLASHPVLVQSVCQGAQLYGVGSGASHLVNGHSTAHHLLEEALAQFTGFSEALLFSTGYMANIGVVTALVGRNDAIFADKLNHASLNDAAILSRAQLIRYPHFDLLTLERRLIASKAKRKLIITDAVFSMDGDVAPVENLVKLCNKYNAMLLLDDAHGFGVLGRNGRGILFTSEKRIESVRTALHASNIIYMATLGKAAGVFGAFVAASSEIIATLIQAAKSYIYTTASPPILAHILLKSLQLIEQDNWRRERLFQLIKQLKDAMRTLRWRLLPSNTPIQPLLIGDTKEAMRISQNLKSQGILVPAIRPPTVPRNTARLRISLSASHRDEDIARLASALQNTNAA
ncbi:8-amino-7-oxononanoate synthase [Nitrosomonas aestuarii]|uniref:8-amino-7-oxononanoate synthase n=1 Tax=Nitrosomonas aestuarii TaxID=52441 RepID=A0A1I3ZEI5_9PROT|nr:8-amino-7-oxononanoate synthase [Nitrosomonas aestuarii]SFK42300.1 8-amino-7-oxononanoate synthase [Nitrosomonas aestuarii]